MIQNTDKKSDKKLVATPHNSIQINKLESAQHEAADQASKYKAKNEQLQNEIKDLQNQMRSQEAKLRTEKDKWAAEKEDLIKQIAKLASKET